LTAIAVAVLVALPMVARANGRVTYLEGKAFRTPAGSGELPSTLAEGDDVEVGDVLETNAASKLEITLADDSVMRLDEKSKATIEEITQNPETTNWKVTVGLALGAVWAKVTHRLGGEQTFEVKTERVVAGVRGTEFLVDASGDHHVQVYDGSVDVGCKGEGSAPMQHHQVGANQHLIVDRQGHSLGPQHLPANQHHNFVKWMRTNEPRLREHGDVHRQKYQNDRKQYGPSGRPGGTRGGGPAMRQGGQQPGGHQGVVQPGGPHNGNQNQQGVVHNGTVQPGGVHGGPQPGGGAPHSSGVQPGGAPHSGGGQPSGAHPGPSPGGQHGGGVPPPQPVKRPPPPPDRDKKHR